MVIQLLEPTHNVSKYIPVRHFVIYYSRSIFVSSVYQPRRRDLHVVGSSILGADDARHVITDKSSYLAYLLIENAVPNPH